MEVNLINWTVNALIKRGRIQSNEFYNENIRSYWFRIFKSGGEGLKKKSKTGSSRSEEDETTSTFNSGLILFFEDFFPPFCFIY